MLKCLYSFSSRKRIAALRCLYLSLFWLGYSFEVMCLARVCFVLGVQAVARKTG
jgi:hypothetical protein